MQVPIEQTCLADAPNQEFVPTSHPPGEQFCRTNHLELKLSTENTKHHYLELSSELNPS